MPSPFPCSPLIREWSWKKTQTKKIINSMVVEARQSFQFFRQITWFLGNNRTLSKCRYRIFLSFISIIQL